ncbi:uncharacterized protein LOC142776249 [Rhipicephalus microplus]|uniref:uncharacterized protein LOC142776249 n=1 Tax=Rhipicephalus microplus TaxID=6941 RepID=UPI003F6ADB3C
MPVAHSLPRSGTHDLHSLLLQEIALGYVLQRGSSLRESTRVLLSMSLAGRWYASLAGGKNKSAYAVGAKCKPFEFASGVNELDSRVTACTEQHYVGHVTRDEQREVMSTYDENTGLAFVFDSEQTLYAKASGRHIVRVSRADVEVLLVHS